MHFSSIHFTIVTNGIRFSPGFLEHREIFCGGLCADMGREDAYQGEQNLMFCWLKKKKRGKKEEKMIIFSTTKKEYFNSFYQFCMSFTVLMVYCY